MVWPMPLCTGVPAAPRSTAVHPASVKRATIAPEADRVSGFLRRDEVGIYQLDAPGRPHLPQRHIPGLEARLKSPH